MEVEMFQNRSFRDKNVTVRLYFEQLSTRGRQLFRFSPSCAVHYPVNMLHWVLYNYRTAWAYRFGACPMLDKSSAFQLHIYRLMFCFIYWLINAVKTVISTRYTDKLPYWLWSVEVKIDLYFLKFSTPSSTTLLSSYAFGYFINIHVPWLTCVASSEHLSITFTAHGRRPYRGCDKVLTVF